jgi:cytochrome c551
MKYRLSFIGVIYLILMSCSGSTRPKDIKFRQYYLKGEQLYVSNCTNCHQKSGKGLGLLYPPLDSADFMKTNVDEVLCIIKYGTDGELIVNNKSFNQPMPAFPLLTDLEIAQIATYIYNTWSNDKGMFEVKDVSLKLKGCAGH